MTNQQYEEEIANHLNSATSADRKRVQEDEIFKMANKDGDLKGALERCWGIIHGNAKDKKGAKRVKKQIQQRRVSDELQKFI
jgi:hypothetical protein